jgi:hypothetical protein
LSGVAKYKLVSSEAPEAASAQSGVRKLLSISDISPVAFIKARVMLE